MQPVNNAGWLCDKIFSHYQEIAYFAVVPFFWYTLYVCALLASDISARLLLSVFNFFNISNIIWSVQRVLLVYSDLPAAVYCLWLRRTCFAVKSFKSDCGILLAISMFVCLYRSVQVCSILCLFVCVFVPPPIVIKYCMFSVVSTNWINDTVLVSHIFTYFSPPYLQ